MGIVRLNNPITVKPTIKPQDIKDKIVSAFQRNALLDSRRIKIETRGSKVILSGSVRSWGESRSPVGGLGGARRVRTREQD
jgi:osmotically-inducible protein OsmY